MSARVVVGPLTCPYSSGVVANLLRQVNRMRQKIVVNRARQQFKANRTDNRRRPTVDNSWSTSVDRNPSAGGCSLAITWLKGSTLPVRVTGSLANLVVGACCVCVVECTGQLRGAWLAPAPGPKTGPTSSTADLWPNWDSGWPTRTPSTVVRPTWLGGRPSRRCVHTHSNTNELCEQGRLFRVKKVEKLSEQGVRASRIDIFDLYSLHFCGYAVCT